MRGLVMRFVWYCYTFNILFQHHELQVEGLSADSGQADIKNKQTPEHLQSGWMKSPDDKTESTNLDKIAAHRG